MIKRISIVMALGLLACDRSDSSTRMQLQALRSDMEIVKGRVRKLEAKARVYRRNIDFLSRHTNVELPTSFKIVEPFEIDPALKGKK